MRLRAVDVGDAGAFHAVVAANREHLEAVMPTTHHPGDSIEAARKRINDMRNAARCGEMIVYAIRLDAEQPIIGTVSLHARIGAGALEIGYWIARSHERRGFAKEAAAAMLHIGFVCLALHRMEIHTDPANLASIGVARSNGLREHAVVRNCVLSASSSRRDSVIWAMTREQYLASEVSRTPVAARDQRGRCGA